MPDFDFAALWELIIAFDFAGIWAMIQAFFGGLFA